MGKIYYIMGKSGSGKDTIYKEVIGQQELHLKNMVLYTTRPIRENEKDGREYHFVDEKTACELERQGKVIEMRSYHTVHGIWKYFTVDNENTDLETQDYLAIGTLESYAKLKDYYGAGRVVPVYIEVEDGLRLERALKRERKPQNGRYEEMCRRFLADCADFSEENLQKAGITRRFENNHDREECIKEIEDFIRSCRMEKE